MPSHKQVIVKIELGAIYSPIFGTWKWQNKDFKTPLNFLVESVKVELFLENQIEKFSSTKTRRDLEPFVNVFLLLKFKNPSNDFIHGLKGKNGKDTSVAAKRIHGIYEDVINKFEILLRTIGGVKHLSDIKISPLESLFEKDFFKYPVSFQIDKEEFREFKPSFPKGHRRRYPLYKVEQLITSNKWRDMQEAIDNSEFVNQEIVEILRIRAKLLGKNKKIATLESAILFESLLRDYARRILKEKGLSNTKIKQLKDELSFNNILNLLLPFSLKKTELKKLQESINAIDKLRKIRNDLVHGEINEDEIDENLVEKGIEGGLKLVKFLIE